MTWGGKRWGDGTYSAYTYTDGPKANRSRILSLLQIIYEYV